MSEQNQLSQNKLFGDDPNATGGTASENGASPSGGKASRRVKLPLSSREQLNATIKSVRDLLRKDAGLAGDTDRLPQRLPGELSDRREQRNAVRQMRPVQPDQ